MGERSYFFSMRHNFSQQSYVKYSTFPSALCYSYGEVAFDEGKIPGLYSRRSQCKSELFSFENGCYH